MEEMTLKEVLVQCGKIHFNLCTVFQPTFELKMVDTNYKDSVKFKKVSHFQTFGSDNKCTFETGSQKDDSLLLVVFTDGSISFANKKMKFIK